jgi:hypothetical protein
MSFVPAQSNNDLFAVLGVIVAAALGLLGWARRDEVLRRSPSDDPGLTPENGGDPSPAGTGSDRASEIR